jgi:hypothetical protein
MYFFDMCAYIIQSSSDDKPLNCYQIDGCDDHYVESAAATLLLNITCIACDDIPQMSHVSIFWQVAASTMLLSNFAIMFLVSCFLFSLHYSIYLLPARRGIDYIYLLSFF